MRKVSKLIAFSACLFSTLLMAPFPLRAEPLDTDHDGAADSTEFMFGTLPRNPDTDGDLLSDGAEIKLGLDPKNVDSDGDGLGDGAELIGGTDPNNIDSDGDGTDDLHDPTPTYSDSGGIEAPSPDFEIMNVYDPEVLQQILDNDWIILPTPADGPAPLPLEGPPDPPPAQAPDPNSVSVLVAPKLAPPPPMKNGMRP